VFLASFPSGAWQSNCYIAGAADQSDVVVIDPGDGALAPLREVMTDEQLTPVAVLLTHGHFDHVASAAEFADAYGIPVHIHPADRELLSDPAAGVSRESAAMLAQLLPVTGLVEPADVRDLADGQLLDLAGITFRVVHAPGHRPGCVMFLMPHPDDPFSSVAFTGDVLFAGSIGRTDLPGGSMPDMVATLRDVVLELPDDTALLPGHGPQTTMVAERATNPYLQPDFLRSAL